MQQNIWTTLARCALNINIKNIYECICPSFIILTLMSSSSWWICPADSSYRICFVQGDGVRTSITVDFGDGHALTYSNVSSMEDGIKHIYKTVGIYRVTAMAENNLGSETATLYLHVTCEAARRSHTPLCAGSDKSLFSFPSPAFYLVGWNCCCLLTRGVHLVLSFISSQDRFISKQTREREEIFLHFLSSPPLPPASRSDRPHRLGSIQSLADVKRSWLIDQGQPLLLPHLSIPSASHINSVSLGSGGLRMKNTAQMAAICSRACSPPTYKSTLLPGFNK